MVVTNEYLFLLELKSHKGTSLPFSCIRKNQIEQMANIDHKKIKAYFIINFREKEKTYAVEAKKLKEYMESTERKSIPIQWCIDNGIMITGIKKKVKYRYLLDDFLNLERS